MAVLRALRDYLTGETYFQHSRDGMNFRRTAGAIVWPHRDLPGCVVALGETRSKATVVGIARHDVRKLEEFQSANTAELVERLERMTDAWLISEWATPLCDKRFYLLEDANAERRKLRRRSLRYGDPLGFSGKGESLLPFYHALAQRRTLSEKTLFVGEGQCADEIAALKFEDEAASILETPSAAALFFALAAIDLSPRAEWGERRRDTDRDGPADALGGY